MEEKEEEEDGSIVGHENIKYLLSGADSKLQMKAVNSTSQILGYPMMAEASVFQDFLPCHHQG